MPLRWHEATEVSDRVLWVIFCAVSASAQSENGIDLLERRRCINDVLDN
jgi:hypothetical protein